MAKFIPLVIRERIEGAPGVVDPVDFEVCVNIDSITLFNRGEEQDITFVRLSCGATLCVSMKYDKFVKKLHSLGYNFSEKEDLQSDRKVRKK